MRSYGLDFVWDDWSPGCLGLILTGCGLGFRDPIGTDEVLGFRRSMV